MTDKQINLAIGAIIHAELVMDFPDVVLDALNSVITFLATMDEQPERKKGKWMDTGSGQECSECHEIQYGYDNFRYFCAFCGSYNGDDVDMREGEQDD